MIEWNGMDFGEPQSCFFNGRRGGVEEREGEGKRTG